MSTSPIRSLFIILLACLLLSACRLNNRTENNPDTNATVLPAESTSAPILTAPPLTAPTSPPEITTQILQFTPGRNDYTISVDDAPREFIVYVPSGYDSSRPTPVVVMCHGSNQHPETMYENTSWVRKADEETIIIVFPASWKYPLITEQGVHEKWNTPGTATEVVPGTELKDDVKFIRTIIDDLKLTFNVDEKRIFASGFSNGAGFTITRLLLEMNDVFAAYGTSGAGLLGEAASSEFPVTVPASLYSTIGTNDNKLSEGQEIPVPFPFEANAIVNDPIFGAMLQKTSALLGLDMSYTVESERDTTTIIFANSTVGANNEYIFTMIRGIGHVYPSTDNRAGIDVADKFWEFFLRHAKP